METTDSPFANLNNVQGPLDRVKILQELERWNKLPPANVTPVILADLIGLHLGVNDEGGSSWGTRYGPWATFVRGNTNIEVPSRDELAPEMVDVWEQRAHAALHPVLRHRYADLVWDLSQLVRGVRPSVEFARLAIDAAIEGLRTRVLGRTVEAYNYADRALDLATSINDPSLAESVERALLEYERASARDSLAGTWGKSLDLILEGRSKLTEAEQTSVIGDMERRLERLAALVPPELNPHNVEAAAIRLAKYFQKNRRDADAARVVRVYAAAFRAASKAAQGMVATSWLEKVHAVLEQYGLKADADALVPELREHGKRSVAELTSYSTTAPFSEEQMAAFVNKLLAGDADTALLRLTINFIPDRDKSEKKVREIAKQAVFTSMASKKIIDNDGRTIAVIGSVEDDIDGNVIQHISQNLQISSIFLRVSLEEAIRRIPLNVQSMMERFRRSPVFEEDRLPLVEEGLRHYFDGHYAAATHMLTPQIEAVVRRLATLTGANIYKRNRNSKLLELRLLHDLLLDEHVVGTLTPNVALYLRILLVDQRGWNLRNELCHGHLKADYFTPALADRVLHALMLFLRFEEKKSDAGTTD
ncbi:DUF4209 domain-containing protein [Archangium violaceum]|uniref:DUF4209 domain-containing protein n=1 Tax=Archangium violaceum TaxID=83451 RepID=UPI002B2C34AC|nr:DUF4209 domain-containing protein [Archangium violaceum]